MPRRRVPRLAKASCRQAAFADRRAHRGAWVRLSGEPKIPWKLGGAEMRSNSAGDDLDGDGALRRFL